jgi:hypothetical protein
MFARKESPLLTESQVQRSFRALFTSREVAPDAFEKAEELIEQLRPESPLRHRLTTELEEIRSVCETQA